MVRLLALVCLLVSAAGLLLDARDSGKAVEGYPLIAVLGILGCVSLLAFHIYAEKSKAPRTGKDFTDQVLSELGVKSLSKAKRLIGKAEAAKAEAKAANIEERAAKSALALVSTCLMTGAFSTMPAKCQTLNLC